MKALVYTGPLGLEMQEAPDPVPAPGQALVRVGAVGLCGSDMHAYLGHDERRPPPLILGHEAAGTVIAGPGAGGRVTVNPLVSCGTCRWCAEGRDNLCPERKIISMPPREGAFAELVAMREENLVAVPDHITDDQACLAEPLACGWHAVRLAAAVLHGPLAAADCLVLGGGAIGMGAALSLRAQGASHVTIAETNRLRWPALQSQGFDVIHPGETSVASGGDADVIIDAVGYAATREEATRRIRPGGVIAHIGLGDGAGGLDIRRMTLQEVTFFGTYTYTPQDFRDTAAAIFDGRLGPLDWIETRPLADAPATFEELREGRLAAPKVVFHPG